MRGELTGWISSCENYFDILYVYIIVSLPLNLRGAFITHLAYPSRKMFFIWRSTRSGETEN